MGLVWTENLEKFQKGIEAKIKEMFARKTDIPKKLPASGGNADTVNNHEVNADVPSDAKFTDTTYGEATASTNGLMSSTDKAKLDGIAEKANNYSLPAASSTTLGGVKTGYTANNQNYPVRLDNGQMYVNVPWTDTNTTYGPMKGATASAAGTAGLVPAPAKGLINSFLRGDGAWVEMIEATDAEIDAIIAGTFK